jgi:hypothetical protein
MTCTVYLYSVLFLNQVYSPPHPSLHGVSVYWRKFVRERVKGDFG